MSTTEGLEDSHASSKSTLSGKYDARSEEGSPKDVTIEFHIGADSDNGADQLILRHDLWRISLYYIYIELTPPQVEMHVDVQRQTCKELGLKGRIRVSQEGVNGVLSGKYEALQIYEKAITRALQKVVKDEASKSQGAVMVTDNNTDSNSNEDHAKIIDLDVKYCELRAELPIQKQLFDRLIVQKTKHVIGLFDQSYGQELRRQQQKSLKSERYRRKRERKRKEQEANRKINIDNLQQSPSGPQAQQSDSSTSSIIPTNDKILTDKDGKEAMNKQDIPLASRALDMSSLYRSVMENPLKSSEHLSATEWNDKLDAVESSGKSALLLDVRNVYEMKVGHFVHPSTPTLLPNTRKYSDLPQILASNKEMQERDQVFMYCTGGVRCERVSMLVRELYPEKEIFQLQGGIQRYLETCSEQNQRPKPQTGSDNNSTKNNPGYFVGKNFVFDPRRTDPIHFGETVGRCLICKAPHDDYDNGHAPREKKEARCNNCRMLVLICNDCRPKYRCHGESDCGGSDDDGREDKIQQQTSKNYSLRPLLFCNIDVCIQEGSTPDPELRRAVI